MHNVLHLACREARINSKYQSLLASNGRLIDRICSLLETAELRYKERAMTDTTSKGYGPLHYLCRSSGNEESVERLLANLSPSVVIQAVTAKTKMGQTPFHFVCRYGSLAMFNRLVEKMENSCLGSAYYFLKQHEAELKKIVEANAKTTGFCESEFQAALRDLHDKNKAYSELVEMYRYLEQREQEWSGAQNYKNRKDDFLRQLKSCVWALGESSTDAEYKFVSNDKYQISGCCFSLFRSQRYYNRMESLVHNQTGITKDTLKKFEQFLLLKKDNRLADEIHQVLVSPAPERHVTDLLVASAPFEQGAVAEFHIPSAAPVRQGGLPDQTPPPPYYHSSSTSFSPSPTGN